MERRDKEIRIQRLTPYRFKPGQSGNVRGRPKKEHELRWYLEGVQLQMKIPSEFYRNAMLICGFHKQLKQIDELMTKRGMDMQNPKVLKRIPKIIKNLNFGQYSAMRAGFEAAKDPYLFIRLIEQVHGKPLQATAIGNPDGSPSRPSASSVLVVNVSADEDDEVMRITRSPLSF